MKSIPSVISTLAILALALLPARAATYPGPGVAVGTTADGNAFSSVVVNNTASTISFTLNTTANMASYIFYAIEIQHIGQAGSGDMGFSNPWGPSIGISSGVNALINTFGSGASALTYNGSWTQNASGPYAAGGTGTPSAMMTFSLGSLGLSVGDSFYFDVISTYTTQPNGFGQAAYGVLDNTTYVPESDGLYQPWNPNGYASYYDSATSPNTTFGTDATKYTVVPEPGTCTLLGLGVLVMIRRVARRNA